MSRHDVSRVLVRLTFILQIGWKGEMIGGCSRNFKAWSAEQWWGHVRVCVCVIQDTSQRDAAGFGDGLKW